jgi:hypothetical protein
MRTINGWSLGFLEIPAALIACRNALTSLGLYALTCSMFMKMKSIVGSPAARAAASGVRAGANHPSTTFPSESRSTTRL